jgi:hypothetical protein
MRSCYAGAVNVNARAFWTAVGVIVAGSVSWVVVHRMARRVSEVDDGADANVAPPPKTIHEMPDSNDDRESNEYPPEATDAAVMSPACWKRWLALRDALDRKRAAVDGCATPGPTDPPTLGCATASDGTWATDVIDASVVEDCALDLQLRIAHVADAGVAFGAPFGATDAWNGGNLVLLRVLDDYDHDGTSEALFTYANAMTEGLKTSTSTVLTVRGGAVVPYAPAASFATSDALDIDGDGRIDLVGRGPFGAVTAQTALSQVDAAPEIFAAHSLPDGTFSTTDAVARDFTKRKCAAAARAVKGTYESLGDDALAIVCARVAGVAQATVQGWIDKACPADAGPYDCRSWETAMAAVATP